MNETTPSIIQFELPTHLACPLPTEERNMKRDEVRLMVTSDEEKIEHSTFNHLSTFLQQDDVLVVNTSATLPSALPVTLPGNREGRLHFSTKMQGDLWLVEIRESSGNKTKRWKEGEEGMTFPLPLSASLTLQQKFYNDDQWLDLWIAAFNCNRPAEEYLANHAKPIQYENLDRVYPLSYYQTYFSFHPGSSEMPSAGRGFTVSLIERLLKKGISIVPVLLHTGVSSVEEHETPYPEYMEIDPVAAATINHAKQHGRRIIAVGTTAIRAIETAADEHGNVMSYRGNTDLFIEDGYTMKVTDGLLTGFHEPNASHLNILQTVAGFDHINNAYKEAIKREYYWHQFGDLHLILP
ncbi:MAG: S-adenosylmethionine:tRNA ribosyltransferase-isomerase [Ginsengibacter sp.]